LIGQIVVVCLGAQILFLSAFISLSLPTANFSNLQLYTYKLARKVVKHLPLEKRDFVETHFSLLSESRADIDLTKVRYSSYVPLLPFVVFIGYVLGLPLGVIAGVIYIVLGLCGPFIGIYPFADGGGLHYYSQPGFGYLIGIAFTMAFVGWMTSGARNSVRQLLAIVGGLLIVHIIGIAYLFGTAFFVLIFHSKASYLNWQPWILAQVRNLSWYQLPYDFLFSLVLIGLSFPVRYLVDLLTAPDISIRAKSKWKGIAEEA
jgi:biotin transporter BioY